jgi:putative mRNA 3-end processing factor
MKAIEASGASQVWTTHGYREAVARWLREKGVDAQAVEARYEGDAATEKEEEE